LIADPEPSLGARFGQIGILGWTIIVPTLLCLFLGRWLDRIFGTGIFFSLRSSWPAPRSAFGRPGGGCIAKG
jgi:Putative F0F1-ATPase subunit Ca2+/Mg2+ transporter